MAPLTEEATKETTEVVTREAGWKGVSLVGLLSSTQPKRQRAHVSVQIVEVLEVSGLPDLNLIYFCLSIDNFYLL